ADLDRALLAGFLPSARPVLILATKMDKLTSSAQRAARTAIEQACRETWPSHAASVAVVAFSATRQTGIDAAEAVIAQWLAADYSSPAPTAAQKKRPRGQGE